jgi:3-deoxy-D-manno-octulosonic-acid transferase
MIAPRHPERFSDVADLLKASGLRWARRSAPPDASDAPAEVILLDSIGELQAVYSLAAIVFVGGSLVNTGGHNILEPAAVGVPVIVGPHTHNFQSIVQTFVNAGAIVQLTPMPDSAAAVELGNIIAAWLADPVKRRELGIRGRNLVAENRGATARTLRLLEPLLGKPKSAVESFGPSPAKSAPVA